VLILVQSVWITWGVFARYILRDPDETVTEATALLLAKQLRNLGVVTSQLAHGLPVGSDLEYSDRLTVSRALRGRVRLDQ